LHGFLLPNINQKNKNNLNDPILLVIKNKLSWLYSTGSKKELQLGADCILVDQQSRK
jgi:hypothetical protein